MLILSTLIVQAAGLGVAPATLKFENALKGATTETTAETILNVKEKKGFIVPLPKVVTVSELASALNAIGATPADIIAILNTLKKAGALQAKLEIM